MRISWATLVLLIAIVIVSIFVANVANLINIDRNNLTKNAVPNEPAAHRSATVAEHRHRFAAPMGRRGAHLMWFLQISDLHISIFGDPTRISQLREFVDVTLTAIRPSVVLASGDLTDAKDSDHLGSRQYRAEWQIYDDILREANVRNRTLWLDIRGNHDNFNVPGDASAQNFFREFSVQGAAHPRSYMRTVHGVAGPERYTFIAVDACLDPGPKRPFNFIGVLSAKDTDDIERLAQEARLAGSSYTIWFGHYPTSCVVSMGAGSWGLRRVIGAHEESMVYMCGHLHRLGGLVPQMYTLQSEWGFLELELGDWKANRTYRLAAIDHGMFTFVDVQQGQWPVVLVTNPKNALYHLPTKENPVMQLGELEDGRQRARVLCGLYLQYIYIRISTPHQIPLTFGCCCSPPTPSSAAACASMRAHGANARHPTTSRSCLSPPGRPPIMRTVCTSCTCASAT